MDWWPGQIELHTRNKRATALVLYKSRTYLGAALRKRVWFVPICIAMAHSHFSNPLEFYSVYIMCIQTRGGLPNKYTIFFGNKNVPATSKKLFYSAHATVSRRITLDKSFVRCSFNYLMCMAHEVGISIVIRWIRCPDEGETTNTTHAIRLMLQVIRRCHPRGYRLQSICSNAKRGWNERETGLLVLIDCIRIGRAMDDHHIDDSVSE